MGAAAFNVSRSSVDPVISIQPARIGCTDSVGIAIYATFPGGLGTIIGFQVLYDGFDVTSLVVPYIGELADTAASILIPSFPWAAGLQATIQVHLFTTNGSASDTLVIDTTG